MSFKLLDRARMAVSGSPGTGDITVSGALAGYQTFVQAGLNDGDTFPYVATDGTNWEYGIATWTFATSKLSRAPNWTSGQSASPISLSSKTVVSATLRAEDISGAQALTSLSDVNITPGPSTDGFMVAWSDGTGKFVLLQPTYAALPDKPTIPANNNFLLSNLGDVNATPSAFTDGYVVTWNQTSGRYVLSPTTTGSTLASLGDVTISTPTNGQVLKYNSGASKWENATAPGGAISTLSDVTLTSLSTNQILQWSGTTWANVAIPNKSLVSLSDVNITTGGGVDGYSVTWNNGTGKFVLTNITGGGGGGGGAGTVGTPPSFVQFGSTSTSSGSGSPPATTLGGAPANGNLLIAITWQDGNSQPTAASGWTLQETQSDGAYWIQIFTKVCGGSESTSQTPAAGGNGGHWTIGMWEIHGQNASPNVLFLTNYSPSNTRAISTPTFPQSSGTFFCASIASNTATDTLSGVYGTATVDANLTSANIPAAFGHSDSNYTAYMLAGKQSGFVASAWAVAILTS